MSLCENLFRLRDTVISQECQDCINSTKKWSFEDDTDFLTVFEHCAVVSVTNEVLEKMHEEYKLEHKNRYNVSKGSAENEFIATYNDTERPHDTYKVRCDASNNLYCWCCVRMGYPCRHVFAVAEAFSIKVSLSSINTRFYLNQESVDFTKESPRAFEVMMKSTEKKEADYKHSKPERFRDVSTNDRAVVERGFKEALVRNGIIAEYHKVSGEVVMLPQCEQFPEYGLPSSTPTLEEEETIQIIDLIDNDSKTTREAEAVEVEIVMEEEEEEEGSSPKVIYAPHIKQQLKPSTPCESQKEEEKFSYMQSSDRTDPKVKALMLAELEEWKKLKSAQEQKKVFIQYIHDTWNSMSMAKKEEMIAAVLEEKYSASKKEAKGTGRPTRKEAK